MNVPDSPSTRHKAVSMTVHGVVQGVGFRYYTQVSAQRLGVYGWVRNRADGTVEIWAEGTDDRLKSFISKIRQGPSHGQVDRVDVEWTAPQGISRSFRIRD